MVKYFQPVQPKPAHVEVAIDHQMTMIHVQVDKNFIDDVLIDGGPKVNIITKNLQIQLGMSKPNSMPYNLRMANHTIAKPLGLTRDLKIFVHEIPYTITFTIINSNVKNSNYSMLLGCPWLIDAKISQN